MILLKTGDNLTWYLSAIRSSSVPSFTRIDALSTLASIESTISPFNHNQLFSGTLEITWSWTMAARSLKIWLTSPMSASSWATLRSLSCKFSRFCSSSSISCLGKHVIGCTFQTDKPFCEDSVMHYVGWLLYYNAMFQIFLTVPLWTKALYAVFTV